MSCITQNQYQFVYSTGRLYPPEPQTFDNITIKSELLTSGILPDNYSRDQHRNEYLCEKDFPMKRLTVLLLIIVCALNFLNAQEVTNYTDAAGLKQGHWIGKYPNGSIRYDGTFSNNKPVGEWKRFHENGKLNALLSHLSNSDKVVAELFDNSGIRYAKGIYRGTLKDSTWSYFNNQKLVGQEVYSNGRKNGLSRNFYESGTPITESNWVDGLQEGVSRTYFLSAKKKTETMYLKGLRNGLMLSYYESGIPQITGKYQNDLPDGVWKFADQNGKIKYELKYQSGVLLNPEVADSLMENEFKAFDRTKGKLKDPEDFTQRPEEYMR